MNRLYRMSVTSNTSRSTAAAETRATEGSSFTTRTSSPPSYRTIDRQRRLQSAITGTTAGLGSRMAERARVR